MFRTTLLAATMLAGSALAQTPATEPLTPNRAEASATPDDGEIVVTARRRTETLISVPIAVTAISGDTLAAQGAPDITSLQRQTPSLTLETARGSNSTLIAFIRGVGQQDPLWGFEPGVGLYVDDVYVARPQGAVLDIFDVERVEVLRGPQGTLYGRNTIGGAIKYVTKRLGRDFRATARGTYGSYNQIDLVGQVTVPLTDTLSVGGAVARYWRDGYGKNLNTGAEQYDKDVLAARASLEWSPGDAFFLRVAGDQVLDKSNPRHGTRLVGNGGVAAFEPTPSVYDTRAGIGDTNRVKTRGLSVTAEMKLSDAVTAKSITAWRDGRTDTLIDFDNTPGPVLDVPAFYSDRQFTQEAQLLFTGGRVQGVVGAYYLNGRASGAFDTVLGLANLTTLTSGTVLTKSYAIFGDLSVDLTETLKLSAGLRWTKDEKTGTVFRRNYTGIRSPLFGNAAAIPGLIRTNYTNSRDFERATPRVSLSYQPNGDLNLYASYGRGFKSGGFDMRGDAVFIPGTVNGYNPETIDSYELGMKGAFLDRTLFLNLAGWYSRYKDQQVTIQQAFPGGIASVVDNAGKADLHGFEMEARVVPTRNISANIAFGYTKAKYLEFRTFIAGGTAPVDVASQRVFQNTPRYTVSTSVTFSQDVAGGTLAFTPALSYRSALNIFEIPTPALDQPGYALVDASLNWVSASGTVRVAVNGRNLTNERYRVGGYNFPGALFGNSIIGYYGPPRTVAGTLEFRY